LQATNGIRAVLFDLDGTLRHSNPGYNQTFVRFARRLDAPELPGMAVKVMRFLHYYWAQSPELLSDLETYPSMQDAFWSNHARRALLAMGCTPEQAGHLAPGVSSSMLSEFDPEDWVPPDVPQTLTTLKQAGYRLAVVSNRSRSYDELLQSLGLDRYFEFALAAGDYEAWKPEPQIFHLAVERLGVSASETLYVGDNYYADVIGAQRARLNPVLIDPENIFPEADCPSIRSIGELPGLLVR